VDVLELLPGRDVPRGLVFLVGGSEQNTAGRLTGSELALDDVLERLAYVAIVASAVAGHPVDFGELITQLALEGVVQLGSHDEALFCRCLSILCTMQAWSHVS
jgi:hypothetical protein